MQVGLLDTYHNPVSTRRSPAWVVTGLLLGFYLLLYFGKENYDATDAAVRYAKDPLNLLIVKLGWKLNDNGSLWVFNKWYLYAGLYTLGMAIGGYFMLKKHGNSRYHQLRTFSLVGVQAVLGFMLPIALDFAQRPAWYFSYFFPLKYDLFFPYNMDHMQPTVAAWFIFGSFVGLPLLVYFKGKRVYCSWICGCGGLAETFGDPWRHLSDKSAKSWRIEQISIHSVLFAAFAMLGLVIADGLAPADSAIHGWANSYKGLYSLAIGSVFSGVIGTGLYPVMGTRVWCRFGCPMAALLGVIQKFGRFRIAVKKDMCISCGNCSTYCEMGIDVRSYAMQNKDIKRASCVGCGMCAHVCPRGVLQLVTKKDAGPGQHTQEWTLDL